MELDEESGTKRARGRKLGWSERGEAAGKAEKARHVANSSRRVRGNSETLSI